MDLRQTSKSTKTNNHPTCSEVSLRMSAAGAVAGHTHSSLPTAFLLDAETQS